MRAHPAAVPAVRGSGSFAGTGVRISACENVATYTQPSLVRFIDASYIAPAANVLVEGQLLAANVGPGTITPYGTVPANEPRLSRSLRPPAAHAGEHQRHASARTSAFRLPYRQRRGAQRLHGHRSRRSADCRPRAASRLFASSTRRAKTGAVDIYMVPAGVLRWPTPFRWSPIFPSEAPPVISALLRRPSPW